MHIGSLERIRFSSVIDAVTVSVVAGPTCWLAVL
jgi:hypothetical protein